MDADEEYFKTHGEPLFSSHMIDLSEEEVDYNIQTTAKYLKRAAPMKQWLEMVSFHFPLKLMILILLRKLVSLVARRTVSTTRMSTTTPFIPSLRTSLPSTRLFNQFHHTSPLLLDSAMSTVSTSQETLSFTQSSSVSTRNLSRTLSEPRKRSQSS
jgi:hypothetical protein